MEGQTDGRTISKSYSRTAVNSLSETISCPASGFWAIWFIIHIFPTKPSVRPSVYPWITPLNHVNWKNQVAELTLALIKNTIFKHEPLRWSSTVRFLIAFKLWQATKLIIGPNNIPIGTVHHFFQGPAKMLKVALNTCLMHMNPGIDPDHSYLDTTEDPWRTTITLRPNMYWCSLSMVVKCEMSKSAFMRIY